MPNEERNKNSVGVIVGRFQVPQLHGGHVQLIESVLDRHAKVLIVLGIAPIKATKNNPLDFKARQKMIEGAFDSVDVVYCPDHPDNKTWVRKLEEVIEQSCPPNKPIMLYGSRDSFIKIYQTNGGKYKTEELIPKIVASGTNQREFAHLRAKETEDFRHGVVWATGNRYPTAYSTVDVAIVRRENELITHLLMGRKKIDGGNLRFVGGFVDPRRDYDPSKGDVLEINVRREAAEETGLEVGNFKYLGSFPISDWRYASEEDQIFTNLFLADSLFGSPKAGDDMDDGLEWIATKDLIPKENSIIETHKFLYTRVCEEIVKNNRKVQHGFAGNH